MEFLERPLDQSDAAWGAFSRNAKIAILLPLAFQLLVFFRYMDLGDEGARLPVYAVSVVLLLFAYAYFAAHARRRG